MRPHSDAAAGESFDFGLNDPRGIADNHGVVGDIVHHHGARPDHAVRSNRLARQKCRARSDHGATPDMAAGCDRHARANGREFLDAAMMSDRRAPADENELREFGFRRDDRERVDVTAASKIGRLCNDSARIYQPGKLCESLIAGKSNPRMAVCRRDLSGDNRMFPQERRDFFGCEHDRHAGQADICLTGDNAGRNFSVSPQQSVDYVREVGILDAKQNETPFIAVCLRHACFLPYKSVVHSFDSLTGRSMPADQATDNPGVLQRMYESMLESEFASTETQRAHREETLGALLSFAVANVSFYKDRFHGSSDGLLDRWSEVPTMDRTDIDRHYDALSEHQTPEAHGAHRIVKSSGSGGRPLKIKRTVMADIANNAALFRMRTRHDISSTMDLAQIRVFDRGLRRREVQAEHRDRWGMPWLGDARGHKFKLSVFNMPKRQVDWLDDLNQPVVLNTFPSNVLAIDRFLHESGHQISGVRKIMTSGEPVTADVRAAGTRAFDCKIVDNLSTAECGIIATQCPESANYHVVSEICHVEVLRDDGSSCEPGEFGNLTVTPYYNYALPLIRYQTGDIAAFGDSCPCGRTLPTLKPSVYRKKHHIGLGLDVYWRMPEPKNSEISGWLGNGNWRLLQVARDTILIEFARSPTGAVPNGSAVQRLVEAMAEQNVRVTMRECPAIGRGPSGKFAQVENLMY